LGLSDADSLLRRGISLDRAICAGSASSPAADLTLFRRSDNADATAGPHFEQSLVAQGSEGAKHRVGVDTHHGCQVPRRGQALTGLGFAFGDSATDFSCDLVV